MKKNKVIEIESKGLLVCVFALLFLFLYLQRSFKRVDEGFTVAKRKGENLLPNPDFREGTLGWIDFSRRCSFPVFKVSGQEVYVQVSDTEHHLPWSGLFTSVRLGRGYYDQMTGEGDLGSLYEIEFTLDFININLQSDLTLMIRGADDTDRLVEMERGTNSYTVKGESLRDTAVMMGDGGLIDPKTVKLLLETKTFNRQMMTNRISLTVYTEQQLDYVSAYIYSEDAKGTFLVKNSSLTIAKTKHRKSSDEYFHRRYVQDENAIGREFIKIGGLIDYIDLEERPIKPSYRVATDFKKDGPAIITNLDIDRFDRLIQMAIHWDGLLSVAVYIESIDGMIKLDKIIDRNSHYLKNVDIHLVFKKNGEKYYPINELRNIAIAHSRSEFIFTLDVDFVVSSGAFELIKTAMARYPGDVKKTMFIIPAFELDGYDLNHVNLFPKNKKHLLDLIEIDQARMIKKKGAGEAHRPTQYEKWENEYLDRSSGYFVKYEDHYEPYGVFHRSALLYDPYLAGYGWDKSSHAYQWNELEFKFYVLNEPFTIHLEHPQMPWATKTSFDKVFVQSNYFESLVSFHLKHKKSTIKINQMNFPTQCGNQQWIFQ